MTIWNLPKIQAQALAAGSVIVFSIKNGIKYDLTKLDRSFFGLRQSEGYGQIVVNQHGYTKLIKENFVRDPSQLPDNLSHHYLIGFQKTRSLKIKY